MNTMLSILLPHARPGEEGTVKGQRDGLLTCNRVARRIRLTPALSPIAHAIGKRGQRLKGAA
jgi:hypothetical protein